jgi:hypothetical protein
VRTVVTSILAVLLLACPYLCRADQLACCADHCEGSEAPAEDSQVPPLPARDAVSCICAGAIKDAGVRVPVHDVTGVDLPLDVHFISDLSPLTSLLWHLARHGAPPGRAASGSLRVHLLLQVFRC